MTILWRFTPGLGWEGIYGPIRHGDIIEIPDDPPNDDSCPACSRPLPPLGTARCPDCGEPLTVGARLRDAVGEEKAD